MLRYLTLRNFRAFKLQRFDFSRINVFVGPNNSGKSSAISAINLLAQTQQDNDAHVPLVLRGRFDDLGTFHDVVHGNNPNTPISLEFGISKYSYHIDYKYRSQRREIEIAKYVLSDDEGQIYEYVLGPKETYKIRYEYRLFEALARPKGGRVFLDWISTIIIWIWSAFQIRERTYLNQQRN